MVPARAPAHRGGRAGRQRERPARRRDRLAAAEGARLLRPSARRAERARRCGAAPGAARRAPRLQADRHLRRRVHLQHALHVFDLRGRIRGAVLRSRSHGAPQGDHSRRRAEPDRPGDRVRLLLRPRRLRAARGRVRDHHGQLQPGDRQHRLRHLRPAVFRAADRRGRHRPGPQGAGARRAARLHRAVWRADTPKTVASPVAGRHPDPRHLGRRDRHRRGPRALPSAAAEARPAPAGKRRRARDRGSRSGGRACRLPGGDAAQLCAGRARDGDRLRPPRTAPLHAPVR